MANLVVANALVTPRWKSEIVSVPVWLLNALADSIVLH